MPLAGRGGQSGKRSGPRRWSLLLENNLTDKKFDNHYLRLQITIYDSETNKQVSNSSPWVTEPSTPTNPPAFLFPRQAGYNDKTGLTEQTRAQQKRDRKGGDAPVAKSQLKAVRPPSA